MWIELTKKEKEGNRKKKILYFFLPWIFISFMISLSAGTGYLRDPYYHARLGSPIYPPFYAPRNPQNWEAAIIMEFIFLMIIFFLYNYIVKSKKKFRGNTLICKKCWKIKENSDTNIKCSCGGNFVYLDDYRFVEDKNKNITN